jgi:hypothetical protein
MENEEKKKEIRININCYLIRIRKKNFTNSFNTIEDAFNNKTFKEIIQAFIIFLDTHVYQSITRDRILYIDHTLSTHENYYSGIINRGFSGQESYIDEIKKDKPNKIGTVFSNQYNSTPFYFLLSQPEKNSKYIIFLAQSYRQYGFKDLFEEAFKKFYKEKIDPDMVCEFSTLSISSLFDMYINGGNIRKLRFRKHTISKNVENLLSSEDHWDPEDFEMELSVIAKRKGFLGIKKDINTKTASFVETVKIDGFEYDEAFADISFGGRKRILNISHPEDFSASFDLTEKVGIDPVTKHPYFDVLDIETISLLKDEIIPNIK